MALKDWKKIDVSFSNYTIFGWHNKKYGDNALLIDSYPLGMYEVILKNGLLGNTLFQSKTKSQALKFAKQYMRTH